MKGLTELYRGLQFGAGATWWPKIGGFRFGDQTVEIRDNFFDGYEWEECRPHLDVMEG